MLQIRDALVVAREYVNQHQRQQQQQPLFGVHRLGPGLPSEVPHPQQMMQTFKQQQQADPRQQQESQQEELLDATVPGAGATGGSAAPVSTHSPLAAQRPRQQQQQPVEIDPNAPTVPRAEAPEAAAAATTGATVRRIQPQAVTYAAQPQQQQHQDSQPVNGRQPLQQVPVGQQQVGVGTQQQGEKVVVSRTPALESAIDAAAQE